MRYSSFPNLSRYFWKEPNSFSNFKNSPALCTVAWIFFSFLTIPASDMSFSTSLSENRATLLIEKSTKAFWKLGHFFSITFQLRPAVNSDLVIRSKYSSSFLGGLTFQQESSERRLHCSSVHEGSRLQDYSDKSDS